MLTTIEIIFIIALTAELGTKIVALADPEDTFRGAYSLNNCKSKFDVISCVYIWLMPLSAIIATVVYGVSDSIKKFKELPWKHKI